MIINTPELCDIRAEADDATIALRLGVYDILHSEHQEGIDYAADQADILVVGVMPDEYVTRVKGPERPINGEASRVEAIDAAEGVDYSFVAPLGRLAVARTIIGLRPDVYVEGEEHEKPLLKSMFLKVLGTDYVIDRRPHTQSTSLMIAQLGIAGAVAESGLTYRLGQDSSDAA